MRPSSAPHALVGGAAVVVLNAGSLAVMAVAGSLDNGYTADQMVSSTWASTACTPPALAGSVVDVQPTDMGSTMHGWASRAGGDGAMMCGGSPSPKMGSQWRGQMMQVGGHTMPAETVSLRVSDIGAMAHELVVLTPGPGARVGQRSSRPMAPSTNTTASARSRTTAASGSGTASAREAPVGRRCT